MASVYRRPYFQSSKTGGKRVRKLCRTYTCKFKGADGKWKTARGYRDKAASLKLAEKLEKRASREAMGIHDPFEDHEAAELDTHLDSFEVFLRGKGDSDDHVERTKARAKAVIDGCQFTRIAEISGSAVVQYLAECRKSKKFGKMTSNYYLTAIKQFSRWLMRDRRAAVDPLAYLDKLNTEGEKTRYRMAVSDDDFAKIIEAARAGNDTHRLSGPDRAMLYMVAAYTGFRAHELSSMTPESFTLAGERPIAIVTAGYSKRRRQDEQPLRGDLVVTLAQWLEGRPTGAPLWPGKWYRRAAEMLRVDLVAAKVKQTNDEGEVIDFHALRHTYITSLDRSGVYGKLLQSLARHSVPTLTALYTHKTADERDAAVSKLPPVPGAAQSAETTTKERAKKSPRKVRGKKKT